MYLLSVILLMAILPVVSILAENLLFHSQAGIMALAGKWFVFWAMGVRLFTAGLRQVLQPRFTAEVILGIREAGQTILVQELGFANLAMGTLGVATLLNGAWLVPAALTGALFIGMAGIRHAFSKNRNRLETEAMISNLFVVIVLIGYLVWKSV
ncbi:MAG TPA: DUF6790 family protein [Anaerolineales bacterium]|nr:DUF6790 family protein [Anaerolineales bacterium]